MKARDILLFLVLIAVVVLVVARAEVVRQGLDQLLNPQPTPTPSVCDNFRFQGLLPRGVSLRQVEPLDADDDGVQECVVLYEGASEVRSRSGRPVYGLVYHFQVGGVAGARSARLPVSNMHRYELRTDYGREVLLGVATTDTSDFRILTMNADTHGGSELVVLSYDSHGRLVCLSVFRWRDEERGYQLVGYARGDWLETVPSPPARYIDEVFVCDRQWPADADHPDRATGQALIWQDGRLTLDPRHGKVSCSE